MSVTVAFTVNNRPAYLRQTLESWSRVRGIGNARLLFRCEPGCPEAADVCRAVDFAETTVTVNPRRLGVLASPWHALDDAFALSEFAVLAEDDLVVSTDALEYLTWCAQRYSGALGVLAVTTHQHESQPGALRGVRPADWTAAAGWHLWVWGTWRDRWEHLLRPDWDFTYSSGGWDWRIRNHWVIERGMRVIAPCLSRCQHIGRDGGTHATPEQYEDLQSRCYVAAVPPQDYQEVPGA